MRALCPGPFRAMAVCGLRAVATGAAAWPFRRRGRRPFWLWATGFEQEALEATTRIVVVGLEPSLEELDELDDVAQSEEEQAGRLLFAATPSWSEADSDVGMRCSARAWPFQVA